MDENCDWDYVLPRLPLPAPQFAGRPSLLRLVPSYHIDRDGHVALFHIKPH